MSPNIAWTILVGIFPLFVIYLWKIVTYYRTKQYAHLPQLPPSLVWGHLATVGKIRNNHRPNVHVDELFQDMHDQLGNPPLFIADFRPITYVMCIVCNHEVAEQISKSSKLFQYSTPKSPTIRWFQDLFGASSILVAENEEWKCLRKRFNPGFSHKHLMSLMPCILDKTQLFLERLDHYATTGEEFSLDDLCTNLTFDIIGAVTMDTNMDAQLEEEYQGELVRLYRELGYSYRHNNGRWKLLLPFQRRAMGRRLDRLLKAIITEKFEEGSNPDKLSRSVLALSLAEHPKLTPEILTQTCDQLKTFLFAGHDTTSIVLQWSFYQLSRTPRVLRLVCLELDEIFGTDSSPSVVRGNILERGEELLQKLTYTSAVIKEILRLFPPAATARSSPPNTGMTVQLPNGEGLCLDGTILYTCHSIIQRDKSVYGDESNEFIPERWLGGVKDSAPIPPSAWRPFERGPRNCIGQELANIEALVILACAVRRYDWEKVGLGAFKCDDSGAPIMKANGQYDVHSELYSTLEITAKPVDGTKMRVRFAPTV
ncbi:hypothetical protein N7499_005749 [Penicillium canescens]|uniref:Cytochrome P450 n=1 Tax=Penicillium canescens TaxID=5083 RepID=A0AAD6IDB1_PENCN|nr:uncharacterized protein N7446_001518 [Penicillium canescens]KAJ6043323.1 hypothetical protein N7460_004678 [Penicillium canescens]KAJ6054797.1 hypothetical protein N7444_003895 [Penicillium canescens]KAJ6073741.1 hypothetical protein N7446_001518 [Penicillium canescens]KAJ6080875.1 hypothetical protein N7499_005749 [Penicillium canescens]KAJ6177329.1 hypothetical protein N7485_004243 [Penicillium canescens]